MKKYFFLENLPNITVKMAAVIKGMAHQIPAPVPSIGGPPEGNWW